MLENLRETSLAHGGGVSSQLLLSFPDDPRVSPGLSGTGVLGGGVKAQGDGLAGKQVAH